MKTRKNFKLSEEALLNLGRLCGLWGCDQTAVIERALREADPSEMDHEERESTAASLVDDEPVVVMSARQQGKTAAMRLIAKQQQIARPSTAGIDRDKIAAAQRNWGMGGAGKKR